MSGKKNYGSYLYCIQMTWGYWQREKSGRTARSIAEEGSQSKCIENRMPGTCIRQGGIDLVESDKKKREDETFKYLNDQ